MSDGVDTSAEAVTTHAKTHWNGGDYETAALLRALLRERDEARAERDKLTRYLNAVLGAVPSALERPDIAAILRGDAVAVPVELPEEMFVHLEPGAHSRVADAWAKALAASPYAPKET